MMLFGRGRSTKSSRLRLPVAKVVIEKLGPTQEGLAKLTTEEAYRKMVEVEVPAAPVLDHEQVFEDPQIVHNGSVVEGEHPVYGRWRRARPSARFSGTPNEQTPGPPLYGEQSEAILDELGLSKDEQQGLRDSGAVTA